MAYFFLLVTNFVLYFVFSLKSLLLCRPFLASIHWSCEKWPANGSGLDTYMRILTTLHSSCRRESGCSRFGKKTELFWDTLYIQQPLSHLKANQSIQQHSIISYSCHSPQGDYSVTHVHIKYMYNVQPVQILGFIGLHTYILIYAHL